MAAGEHRRALRPSNVSWAMSEKDAPAASKCEAGMACEVSLLWKRVAAAHTLANLLLPFYTPFSAKHPLRGAYVEVITKNNGARFPHKAVLMEFFPVDTCEPVHDMRDEGALWCGRQGFVHD